MLFLQYNRLLLIGTEKRSWNKLLEAASWSPGRSMVAAINQNAVIMCSWTPVLFPACFRGHDQTDSLATPLKKNTFRGYEKRWHPALLLEAKKSLMMSLLPLLSLSSLSKPYRCPGFNCCRQACRCCTLEAILKTEVCTSSWPLACEQVVVKYGQLGLGVGCTGSKKVQTGQSTVGETDERTEAGLQHRTTRTIEHTLCSEGRYVHGCSTPHAGLHHHT